MGKIKAKYINIDETTLDIDGDSLKVKDGVFALASEVNDPSNNGNNLFNDIHVRSKVIFEEPEEGESIGLYIAPRLDTGDGNSLEIKAQPGSGAESTGGSIRLLADQSYAEGGTPVPGSYGDIRLQDNGGNVGIGLAFEPWSGNVDFPEAKLHVAGDIRGDTLRTYSIEGLDDSFISMQPNQMGDVGIGLAFEPWIGNVKFPEARLHVAGDIKSDNAIIANSFELNGDRIEEWTEPDGPEDGAVQFLTITEDGQRFFTGIDTLIWDEHISNLHIRPKRQTHGKLFIPNNTFTNTNTLSYATKIKIDKDDFAAYTGTLSHGCENGDDGYDLCIGVYIQDKYLSYYIRSSDGSEVEEFIRLVPFNKVAQPDHVVVSIERDPATLTPSTNARYLIDFNAVGEWKNEDNKIAVWDGSEWQIDDQKIDPYSFIQTTKDGSWYFSHEHYRHTRDRSSISIYPKAEFNEHIHIGYELNGDGSFTLRVNEERFENTVFSYSEDRDAADLHNSWFSIMGEEREYAAASNVNVYEIGYSNAPTTDTMWNAILAGDSLSDQLDDLQYYFTMESYEPGFHEFIELVNTGSESENSDVTINVHRVEVKDDDGRYMFFPKERRVDSNSGLVLDPCGFIKSIGDILMQPGEHGDSEDGSVLFRSSRDTEFFGNVICNFDIRAEGNVFAESYFGDGEYLDNVGKIHQRNDWQQENYFYQDIEVTPNGGAIILRSPNGARWRVAVEDDGTLTTTNLF